MQTPTIIVPIGLRGEAERVVPLAAAIADATDASMEMVHVVSSLDAPPPQERRRAWMEPLAEKYGASMTLVENLSASAGLRDVIADQPDAVICMGVDASGGALDVLLGSISEDILRSGHNRCFLIGPEVDADVPVASGIPDHSPVPQDFAAECEYLAPEEEVDPRSGQATSSL